METDSKQKDKNQKQEASPPPPPPTAAVDKPALTPPQAIPKGLWVDDAQLNEILQRNLVERYNTERECGMIDPNLELRVTHPVSWKLMIEWLASGQCVLRLNTSTC